MVRVPGASAEEVEKQVSTNLERLLYQIDGVEYVYSMSRPGMAVVTVRFYVGEDREDSLIKLYNQISMNQDIVPSTVAGWIVKPIEIDDVPIVDVTLWSEKGDDFQLRRVAEQVSIELQSVQHTGRTSIVGGRRRQISVWLDAESMTVNDVTPMEIDQVLKGANVALSAGDYDRNNRQIVVESGPFLQNAREMERLVIGVHNGRLVYLRDVARIEDGPEEAETYTRIGFGPGFESPSGETAPSSKSDFPAVTIALAKQKGSNAVEVARQIDAKLDHLQKEVVPSDMHVLITRNYGKTANDKVNELVSELTSAIIIVVGLIALTLGWREAIVVATAVPLTFALTLLVNLLAGYTINRVTLFALILSLGLVVDDPIVDVENIYRHLRMRLESPLKAVFTAVNEVRPPIILATLAVIVSFLPLFFITGMMGPYMRPMALNVPIAMLMSMVVAFTITPWLSYHVMKSVYGKDEEPFVVERSLTYKVYSMVVGPLINRKSLGWGLILVVIILLAICPLLAITGRVPLKMLPFDNKNEFQIVVDMPEGTTLETTEAALSDLSAYLRGVTEVTEVLTFAGTSSPIDFNGMVRHYYLRHGANVGDIRVNLLAKEDRKQQSHAILLRIRDDLHAIAKRWNANIKLVEVPPGPPVLDTLVGEVYGDTVPNYGKLMAGAKYVRKIMEEEPGVVDVDDSVEADQEKQFFAIDKEKASLHGVSAETIAATLRLAVAGHVAGENPRDMSGAGILHVKRELHPLRIVLRLPRVERSSRIDLQRIHVKTGAGDLIPIGELGSFNTVLQDKTIYHKNLQRVAYVFGDTAGLPPANAVLAFMKQLKTHPLPPACASNGPGKVNGKLHSMYSATWAWLSEPRCWASTSCSFGKPKAM